MSTVPTRILTATEQDQLLLVARTALETYIRKSLRIDLDDQGYTPALKQNRACFITLRTPDGELRGCIGSTAHNESLVETVRNNTIKSATRDPRFDPVAPDELSGLTIEISALADGDTAETPFQRIHSVEEILIGRDGLYLESDQQGRGLLLPQVATDRDWSVEEFLEALCRKSGLEAHAWQDPRATLYRFSVQEFSE